MSNPAALAATNGYSPAHPHEPEVPPTFDYEGRCLVCGALVAAEESGYERAQADLVQIGWMMSDELAAELDIMPCDDDYLITLEQAEQDGGIKPDFAERVIPIYRRRRPADA